MKFFIVGKKTVLLGRNTRRNIISFTVGENLSSQKKLAEVVKKKNIIFIKSKASENSNHLSEGFALLLKSIKNNYKKNKIFIDSRIFDLLLNKRIYKKQKSKYKASTDVYRDPLSVPWNFMPTEIEGILSYFNKDILKNKKILYIGAGYGKNIWALGYKKYKYNIDAIEYSKIATDRANVIFGNKIIIHKNLLFFKNFKDKYDVVLDIGCIHCIPAKFRKRAVDIIYNLLKDNGIIISRIFKPRNKKWISRMPFKINSFGLDNHEIEKLFCSKFEVITKYENSDYKILKFVKCKIK